MTGGHEALTLPLAVHTASFSPALVHPVVIETPLLVDRGWRARARPILPRGKVSLT